MDISTLSPDRGPIVPPLMSVGQEALIVDRECECEPEETRQQFVSHVEQSLEGEGEEEEESYEDAVGGGEGKKRVKFRDEEGLTSEFDDSNLWAHDPNETAYDMIEAYKRECGNLKTKPITKLLEQLERLDDLSIPIDTLDLKGVRLDSRSCEVLETVLSRMHMSTLDLERTNLEDEGAIALCEMVEFYGCANKISLAQNNRLRPRAWLMIGRTLKKSPFLDTINVSYCGLEEQTLTLLLRSVRANCALKVLKIEGNNLAGKGTFILMAAMKFNENLRELWLASNHLGPEDGQHLGSILRTNHTLHVLDVRDNNLQDAGVRYICAGIAEQQEGLLTLNFATNNISQEGIHHVSAMLPCTRSLRELNLSNNRYGDNGLFMLKLGLLANRSIEKLNLTNTRMTCEGAIALAEVLAESKHITNLDLRDNDIRVAGLMALQLGHRMNRSLLVMDTPKSFRVDQRDKSLVRDLLSEIEKYCARNRCEREEKVEAERKRQHEAQHAQLGALEDEACVLTAGMSQEGAVLEGVAVGEEEEEEKEVDPSLVGSLDDVYKDEPTAMSDDPFQRMPVMDKEKPPSLMEMEKSMDALAVYTEEEAEESNMDRGVRSAVAGVLREEESTTDEPPRHQGAQYQQQPPRGGGGPWPPSDELPDLVGVSNSHVQQQDSNPPTPDNHHRINRSGRQPVAQAPDVASGTSPCSPTPDLAAGTQRVVDLLDETSDPSARPVDLTAGLAGQQKQ